MEKKSASAEQFYDYGWDYNIKQLTRKRNMNSNELLDCLILFPPAKESQFC